MQNILNEGRITVYHNWNLIRISLFYPGKCKCKWLALVLHTREVLGWISGQEIGWPEVFHIFFIKPMQIKFIQIYMTTARHNV
jgi:hypothetical protein